MVHSVDPALHSVDREAGSQAGGGLAEGPTASTANNPPCVVFMVKRGHRPYHPPPRPVHCTHHPRLGCPGKGGAPQDSGPEEKGIRACQNPAGAARSLKPTQPGRVPGSKILIFPFWGHSMTRLPLLFLCAFSLGWLSPSPRISPSTPACVQSLPAAAA